MAFYTDGAGNRKLTDLVVGVNQLAISKSILQPDDFFRQSSLRDRFWWAIATFAFNVMLLT